MDKNPEIHQQIILQTQLICEEIISEAKIALDILQFDADNQLESLEFVVDQLKLLEVAQARLLKAQTRFNSAIPQLTSILDIRRFGGAEMKQLEEDRIKFKSNLASVRNLQKELHYLQLREENLLHKQYIYNENGNDDLVEVRIEDVKKHFQMLKDDIAIDVLMEAIGFAKERNTWKFWECCIRGCDQKFANQESFINHFDHLHDLHVDKDPDVMEQRATQVGDETVELIVNGVWKPVDIDAYIKMKPRELELLPSCDDPERKSLLEKIESMFQLLLKHGYLSERHVTWPRIVPDKEFGNMILGRHRHALKIIFFSSASNLEIILNFLKFLAGTFGLSETEKTEMSNMGNSIDDGDEDVFDVKEKVLLSGDLSCLLMDKRVLRGEFKLSNVASDGSVVTSADGVCVNDIMSESEKIMPWLYAGLTSEEALESRKGLRDSQKQKAMEVYDIYYGECLRLRRLSKLRKKQWMNLTKLEEKESKRFDKFRRPGIKVRRVQSETQGAKENQLLEELLCYDAILMRSQSLVKKYRRQLWDVYAYDYGSIMLPLLKSFMKSRLEDLADKDDMQQ